MIPDKKNKKQQQSTVSDQPNSLPVPLIHNILTSGTPNQSPPVSSQLPPIFAIQILAATLSHMQTVCKSQYLPVVDALTPPSRHPFSSQTKASPPSSDSTV